MVEKLKIKFPQNEDVEFEYGKPVVLLGANGAGKTRFSVKVEEMNDPTFKNGRAKENIHIHRISAQKSLSIEDSISISDNESAIKKLFLGDSHDYASKLGYRFGSNPAIHLINDYNQALSLLFSETNKELHEHNLKDRKAYEDGTMRPAPPNTLVNRATTIWNELLPHRKIDLSGNGVHVEYNGNKYHGKEMSDGERVMLYMICQVLVQRPNTLLIIDEPELHIHKSLVNKLWTRLEVERPDCVFMYITHDLPFALSRNEARVIWVKNYTGSAWDYEVIDADEYNKLPAELLYEIIGTRQKILFVEGEKNSYDYFLYQEIYKDKGYHIIPCGSCHNVIRYVKSKRIYENLSEIEVFGIIDRDFRTDAELSALANDGIYSLKVAEVENLFVVPGLLDIMERELVCDEGASQKAKDFIKEFFENLKTSQVNMALHQELYHQLSVFDLGKEKQEPAKIKEKLDESFSVEHISDFFDAKQAIFNAATTIDEILKVFNFKSMSKSISDKFGLAKNTYPQRVINLLRSNKSEVKTEMINVLKQYTPDI